jgi:hypothetical protein
MLSSLQHLSERERDAVLSSLIRSLLPDAESVAQEPRLRLPDAEQAVLAELRRQLGLAASDLNEKGRARLLEALSREIVASLRMGRRSEAAKERLGDRGGLSPSQYRIVIPKKQEWELVGVRRNQIERTVTEAQSFLHLMPSDGSVDEPLASLFCREWNVEEPDHRYTLLVQAKRQKAELQISNAWRVYHADVKMEGVVTPLDVLLRFLDRFGVHVTAGQSGRALLHLHVRIPVSEGRFQAFAIRESGLRPHSKVVGGGLVRVHSSGEFAEAALVYAVNLTEYEEAVARHRTAETEQS